MESAQSSNPDLSYEIGAGGTLEQMDTYNEGAIKQLKSLMEEVDEPLKQTFQSLVLLAELKAVAQHNPTAVLDLIMPRERARWGASSSLSAAQSNPIHTRSSSDSALQTEAREQKYNYKFEKTRQENASKESSVSVETDVAVPPSQTSDVQGISAPMPAQPKGTEIELQNYDPTSRKLDNAVVDIPPAQVTGETQAIKKYTNCILQEANGESIIPTMAINVLSVVDGAVFTLAGTGLQDPRLKGMPKLCLKIVLGLLGPSLTCLFCLGAFHGNLPPRFRAPAKYVALACNAAAFFLLLAFFIVN